MRWFHKSNLDFVLEFIEAFAGPDLFSNQEIISSIVNEKGLGLVNLYLVEKGLPVTAFENMPIKGALYVSEISTYLKLINQHPSYDITDDLERIWHFSTIPFKRQVMTKVLDWSKFTDTQIMEIIDTTCPQLVLDLLRGLTKFKIKPDQKEILKRIIWHDDLSIFAKYVKLYPQIITKKSSASFFHMAVKDGGNKIVEWFLKQPKFDIKIDLKLLKAAEKRGSPEGMVLIAKAHSAQCKQCKATVKNISLKNAPTAIAKIIKIHIK